MQWTKPPHDCSLAPIRIHVVDWLLNRPPDEMAFSRPFAAGAKPVWVEFDHLRRTARKLRGLEPALLAHVLVHEIVHVLTGDGGHSPAGMMKAHWNPADCDEMLRRGLPFTPADAVLARAGAERLGPVSASP